MDRFLPEPPFRHGGANQPGVLLVNLGTPEAPTAAALKPYLKQFLSDPRVVEIPRAVWWFILNGIILNTRPAKSAEKYRAVWTPQGSPLRVYTDGQARMLKGYLGNRIKQPVAVEYAMRYGQPSIPTAIDRLRAAGCDRILVLPLYPQYSASTTATAFDEVFRHCMQLRNMPELRTIRHFHDHRGYIAALAQNINNYWMTNGRPDVLVISFHGVPRFSLDRGDPYHCECHKTARLLAQEVGYADGRYKVTFQSRFGRAEWLQPYTSEVLTELGRAKTGRVDVVCPGFVADCLETLEEIALEGRDTFKAAGGGEFHYIPALNFESPWINALTDMVLENLQGWLQPWNPERAQVEQADSRARALQLGAKN